MRIIDMILIVIISIAVAILYIEYQKRKIIVDAYKDTNGNIKYDEKYESIYKQVQAVVNSNELSAYKSKIVKCVYAIAGSFAVTTVILFFLSNYITKMNTVFTYLSIGLLVLIIAAIYLLVRWFFDLESDFFARYKGIVYYEFEKILNAKVMSSEKQIENIKKAYIDSGFDTKYTELRIDEYIQSNINGNVLILTDIKVFKKNNYMFYKIKDNSIEASNGIFICAGTKKGDEFHLKGSLELFDPKKVKTMNPGDTELERQFKDLYFNVSNKPVVLSSNTENILLELYNRFGILLEIEVKGDFIYIKINDKKILYPSVVADSISKEQLWSRYCIISLLLELINEL